MTKSYLGLDPGAQGCITLLSDGTLTHWALAGLTPQDIADTLLHIRATCPLLHAVLEDVKSIHGAGATSTFLLGHAKGLLTGMLAALGIPYTLVSPQVWQRSIFTPADKKYKDGKKLDTKKTSVSAAQRIFPNADFKRTPRCKAPDNNFTDSALMAEYARRLNL